MNYRLDLFAAGLSLCVIAALSGCGHESAASPGGSAPAVVESPAPVSEASVPQSDPAPPEPATEDVAIGAEQPSVAAPKPESPENDAEPPRTKGQRPPADRTPAKPGEAEKITWDDLNLGMPADVVFRPFMLSDRAQELEGKKISILGFIHGAATGGSREKIKQLILLKNTECKYGPQGQADHLAEVVFAEGEAASFTTSAIKVEGTLTIAPVMGKDGNTWSVFRLEDAAVK